MATRTRTAPEVRRQQIVEIGLYIAEKSHYRDVNLAEIARFMKTRGSHISYFFNSNELKKAVLLAAIERENLKIVAQALGAGDLPSGTPREIKRKALHYLARQHRIRKLH
jgi:AcrR family transcriptional regulator